MRPEGLVAFSRGTLPPRLHLALNVTASQDSGPSLYIQLAKQGRTHMLDGILCVLRGMHDWIREVACPCWHSYAAAVSVAGLNGNQDSASASNSSREQLSLLTALHHANAPAPSHVFNHGVMLGCCMAQRAVHWSLLTSIQSQHLGRINAHSTCTQPMTSSSCSPQSHVTIVPLCYK